MISHTEFQLSIIIVVYNAASTIECAIRSVLGQNGQVELIIIDGGSTDGTVDIIRRHEQHLSYWVSESDKGIYDAMNKGIAKAHGNWLYFLGADDQLNDHVLQTILPILRTDSIKLMYGSVKYDTNSLFKSSLGWKIILQNTIHHQAAFYHKSLFTKFRYDVNLSIIADYELNLIVWKEKIPTRELDTIVALCGSSGSSFDKNLSLKEMNLVRNKYVGKVLGNMLSQVLKIKYFIHYVLLRKI